LKGAGYVNIVKPLVVDGACLCSSGEEDKMLETEDEKDKWKE
jgi:hypothetical protein